ncbi:hypothetical protein Sarmat_01148 [Rickettsiales endosymbiont of Paramecium tredecaurelia]|nr:hypothetical protein [Candidatus Sarmatiella mevalonica]
MDAHINAILSHQNHFDQQVDNTVLLNRKKANPKSHQFAAALQRLHPWRFDPPEILRS